MTPHPDVPLPRNRVLAALPRETLAALWPRFEPVEFALRQSVQHAGEPITSVYFVETGYVSMLATLEDGDAAEVGIVGCEGLVGLPLLFGGASFETEIVVQGPVTALRLGANEFREALETTPELRRLCLRWALTQHDQVARIAACNSRHQTEQRLARWLLMAHDRMQTDSFPMTHEFLSMMLSVRRAGVTVAAGQLQKAGFIRYERGIMEVTDRSGLEYASCGCFEAIRGSERRLFADAPPNSGANGVRHR